MAFEFFKRTKSTPEQILANTAALREERHQEALKIADDPALYPGRFSKEHLTAAIEGQLGPDALKRYPDVKAAVEESRKEETKWFKEHEEDGVA
jgi:hypothetical protein